MKNIYLPLLLIMLAFSYHSVAEVNFQAQTISGTLPQAKKEQKILFSVCSSTECHWCRWMDINVYKDESLSKKINNQMIAIKPIASMDRLEFMKHCKALPTMYFFDENGKILRTEIGKKTLSEMTNIVDEVLASNCTSLDAKLDEASGTRKGSVCCDGLMKQTEGDQKICVKQSCVETSDDFVVFPGSEKDSLPCCDASAFKYTEQKMGGGNAKRFGLDFKEEYRITCRDSVLPRWINQKDRKFRIHKGDSQDRPHEDNSGSSVIAH